MNDRRRFLHVLGATTAAAALPGCGSDSTSGTTTTSAGGEGGSGGSSTGGMGGAGGAGGSTSNASSASSSTTSATSSTGTGSGCQDTPPGTLVGVPGDFVTPGLHLVPGSGVLIGRDDKGLYALTSFCTHQSCDMDGKKAGKAIGLVVEDGVVCLCHYSKFDVNGAVVPQFKLPNSSVSHTTPAMVSLKSYAMALSCDGKLYVDKTMTVLKTDRVVA